MQGSFLRSFLLGARALCKRSEFNLILSEGGAAVRFSFHNVVTLLFKS